MLQLLFTFLDHSKKKMEQHDQSVDDKVEQKEDEEEKGNDEEESEDEANQEGNVSEETKEEDDNVSVFAATCGICMWFVPV